MSTRTDLATQLKPLLPRTWKIVPEQRNIDVLTKPLVMLKQLRIEPGKDLPQDHHWVTFVLTIVSPHQDPALAEDQLDDSVAELLFAVDALPHLSWLSAEKVSFQDSYIAYDVTLKAIDHSQRAA